MWNTFTIPLQFLVSFAFSMMENGAVFPGWFRFLIKLMCCIALGSASNPFYLLKCIAINLCSLKYGYFSKQPVV